MRPTDTTAPRAPRQRNAMRPYITSPCVADRYAAPGERIAEVRFPGGTGCLISLRTREDGRHVVEVYSADPSVRVVAPAGAHSQRGR